MYILWLSTLHTPNKGLLHYAINPCFFGRFLTAEL